MSTTESGDPLKLRSKDESDKPKADDLLRLPDWVVFVQQVLEEARRTNLAKEKEKYA